MMLRRQKQRGDIKSPFSVWFQGYLGTAEICNPSSWILGMSRVDVGNKNKDLYAARMEVLSSQCVNVFTPDRKH